MKALLSKELNAFFSSPIAYLTIAVYLLLNGLYLWVLDSDFNILHAGFADLNAYFYLAPWIFVFLIPAITMKSFSEELSSGTMEILRTKPLTTWQIVLGKYVSILLLLILVLIPTLIYVYSVYQLGSPIGNIEIGTTIGSYVGLLFLASAFSAIGLFTSTFSKNQIVSFICGVIISFVFYYGFETIGTYALFGEFDGPIKSLGMYDHFTSLGRGVLDTRDLIYFLSVTVLFLSLTKFRIDS